MNSGVSKLDLN